ncbi:BACON domain-containing protein [Bacteroides sp.]|uniref:BACON domain-containing protein n=1 Tax=Bacteroides sp. TaxID=29523 RepID=UPI0025B88397|nr:BACON domain-containing carbohydrate-binding protein [Bacteroides sp.]
MKQIVSILCLSLLFFACGDDNEKKVEEIGNKISVSNETLAFLNTGEAVGGNNSVKIESDGNWRLSGKKTWCRPSATEGENGETVTFEVDPNPTTDTRSTTFTFICGNQATKVVVTQSQDDLMDIYKDNFEVSRQGGEIVVRVNASNEVNYEIQDDSEDWISLIPESDVQKNTKSLGTSLFRFKVNENDTYQKRTGHIILHLTGGMSKEVTILQDRRIDLNPEKQVYEIPANGGPVNIRISTNLAYKIVVPEYAKSWVTYKAPSEEMEEPESLAIFEESFTIGIQGGVTRVCKIELHSLDGSLNATVMFKQKGNQPQMIEIPDENFRKSLAENYYILNESGNAVCEMTDLGANLTTLGVSGCKIHSLEGIKSFKNLKVLTCNTNYLKTIDIDGTNISTLNADENALETVVCGSAPVSSVNFSVSSYSKTKGLVDPDGNMSARLTVSGDNVTMVQTVSNIALGYLNIVQCPRCSYFTVSGCKAGMKIHINRNYSGYINPNFLPTGAEVIRE